MTHWTESQWHCWCVVWNAALSAGLSGAESDRIATLAAENYKL